MTTDEIIEGIKAICAPLPESRALCDKIIAELETRLDEGVKMRSALDAITAARRDGTYNTGLECREIAFAAVERSDVSRLLDE